MRVYALKAVRLRDGFTNYPVTAVDIKYIEDATQSYRDTLAKASGKDPFQPNGSRRWRNSKVELSIEAKLAPFVATYSKEEWARENL
jgi:hypothetical protein